MWRRGERMSKGAGGVFAALGRKQSKADFATTRFRLRASSFRHRPKGTKGRLRGCASGSTSAPRAGLAHSRPPPKNPRKGYGGVSRSAVFSFRRPEPAAAQLPSTASGLVHTYALVPAAQATRLAGQGHGAIAPHPSQLRCATFPSRGRRRTLPFQKPSPFRRRCRAQRGG